MVSRKQRKKRNKIVVTVIAIFLVLLLIFVFQRGIIGPENMLNLGNLYDENGNKIKQPGLSMVDGITGVAFVDFNVRVDSVDDRIVSIAIESASPVEFEQSLPLNQPIDLPPSGTFTWTSSLVDIRPFEGQQEIFTATVVGNVEGAPPVRETGTITLTIEPDPVGAGFTVGVSGNTGAGEIGGPGEITTIFRTNVVNSLYDGSGSWVAFDHNEDLIMTAFGKTGGACTDFSCNTDMPNAPYGGLTPEGNKMFVKDSDNICICTTSSLPRRYNIGDSDAQNAILNPEPTEPFTTNGQEMYG